MSTATLMTIEEFARMETAETERYELVDGELVSVSSGMPIHGRLRDRMVTRFGNYFAHNRIGESFSETDCRIGDGTVRCPDLGIFLGERWRTIDAYTIPIPFAPDIAIEILSPSERTMGTNRKVRDYLGAGSKEVWLVGHENREVFVHTAKGARLLIAGDVLESPLLPGFSIAVSELFEL